MVWGTYAVKIGALMQLKWAFACVKEGVKACQDACSNPPGKKMPQSARLSAGGEGGCAIAIWAMPK